MPVEYFYYIAMGVLALLCVIIGIAASKSAGKKVRAELERKIGDVDTYLKNNKAKAEEIVRDAEKEAEAKKKASLVETRDEIYKLKVEAENEIKSRRDEVAAEVAVSEARINKQQESIDKKEELLEKRSAALERSEELLSRSQKDIEELRAKVEELFENERNELLRVSNMTEEEARNIVLTNAEQDMTRELAAKYREIDTAMRDEADKNARFIMANAIQHGASDFVVENTVSAVALPSDEMKGRIIGREGRNIKALESLTGVDIIIEDTPETVVVSCFDPVRRQIAKVALQRLVEDGRIHPGRVEEIVAKAEKEVNNHMREEGERVVMEMGIGGINPEIVKLLGRLTYRTSYGQNALQHSIEVSKLAGVMAAEIGANVKLARRAGLLHDLGKAIDHDQKGAHAELGAELAQKYKETETVVNAIRAHHNDVEPMTVEAVLIQAADALSAARPGARRESTDLYIKRLQNLEEIANSYPGVDKAYAIQAGRELRIVVKPEKVSDDEIVLMARDVAKRIENELEYPGQIKVSVLRESRATGLAQ